MKIKATLLALLLAIASFASIVSPATAGNDYRVVPPNMIGLLLTPSGYDQKILTPGQVNIQTESWSGYGNQLVLMQRGGYYIKEQFLKVEPGDKADHRCLVGPNRDPIDLDVRLLFAMPNPETGDGRAAIHRMALLGNPVAYHVAYPDSPSMVGGDRVMVISAESIYQEQVRNQVRGKIRDVCLTDYNDPDDIFTAMTQNGTGEGFSDKIQSVVATVLAENDSPLLLVAAVVSNVKEDPMIVQAMVAQEAAAELVTAMQTIDDFLKDDPTGRRAEIFKLMTMRDMVGLNEGTNTVVMTDVGFGQQPVPLPIQ